MEDFITTHRATYGDSTPFFLYYALQDPHTPLSSPEYFLESEPCASAASFDANLDHFSRISELHAPRHAPRAMILGGAHADRVPIGAYNPM